MDRAILGTVERTPDFLKKNYNILILASDKGNKTVAMDKEEYHKKMKYKLDERNTYRTLRQDPTSRLQIKKP